MSSTMRRTWIVVLCLAAVGAAVFTDNMDEMYRCANADISVVVPGELAAGGTGSIGVLATDMDGVPVEGKLVRVAVISPDGVEEFFGVTGPDGMASVDLDVPQVEGNVTVTVTVDGRLFTEDLRVTEAPPPAIIIQTDKPVYHPGQTVHMRFLVLDGIARRPVTEPVTVSIITPDGDRILEREIPAGRFGVSALDFALSGLLPLGEYLVVADVAGGSETRSFLVDRYVLPRFAIFADGLAPWYTPGDAISFDIVANYTFGRPVSGTIAVDVFGLDTTSGWVTFLDTLSGPLDGRFALRTDVGAADGFDTLLFNVTVTDDAGHEEHETLAAGYYASPLTLTVIGDRNVVGLDSICRFIVTYPDGSPARATLDVSLYEWIGRRDTGDDGGPIGGARTPDDEGGGDDPTGDGDTVYLYGAYYGAGYRYLSTTTVETDARGIASVSFEVTGAAMFMEVNVTDGETVARYPFDLWAADDGIKVIPNQLSYGVGETATFTVISSGGVSGTGFYDVYTCGRHLRSGVFDLGGGAGTIAFTVDPEMVPGFEIRATRVTDDLRIASSSAVVAVSDPDALTVTVVPSGGTYRPGEEVTVDVRTTSGDAPVIAALGVRAVDASVLELAGRMSTEERYGDDGMYTVLRYVEGDAGTPVLFGVVQPEGDVQVSVGAYVNDPDAAAAYGSAGLTWLLVVLSLAIVPALILLARRSQSIAALALMAVALVVLPSVAILSPVSVTTSDGGTYLSACSDDAKRTGTAKGGGGDEATFTDTGEGGGSRTATRLRTYFPETWYWNPLIETAEDGTATIRLTAPDTITTWRMDVVASTLDGKIREGGADIIVFQDFFVEPDLPVRAVLGDEFELRALVYNYLDRATNVGVTLSVEGLTVLSNATRSVRLDPHSVSSVTFHLRADEVGEATVQLEGTNGEVSDAVVRTLRVVPTGEIIESVKSGVLEDDMSVTVPVNMSADRVPGSEVALVKVQGSMAAVALDGVEEYIHFVSGCGEQSMSTLAMDVLAYRLLDPTLAGEKRRGYEEIVVQGILHELTFLKDDPDGHGRGIVWFPSDPAPHPWLTAWGLLTFQDAIDAGFRVDDAIIEDMQEFIVSRQHPDGSFTFPEWGLYEYTPQVLMNKTVSTTAYVARSLLYSGYTGGAIDRAVGYIGEHLEDVWDDPYSLALALIVLRADDLSIVGSVADRLAGMALWEDDEAHWEGADTMIDAGRAAPARELDMWGWGGRSTPRAIETTGYAVMALDGVRDGAAMGGTRYLMNNRGSGGWFSTRDTVVAFQAIVRRAVLHVDNLTVRVLVEGEMVEVIELDEPTADVTRYVDLRPYVADTFNVTLESEGEGQVAYQVVARYHVPPTPVPLPIGVDFDVPVLNVTVGDIVDSSVRVIYNGTEPLQMILVEIPIPAGFSAVTSVLDDLIGAGVADEWETEDGVVRLYVTPVDPGSTIELPIRLRADLAAVSTLDGVVAYDMYEPALRAGAAPVVLSSVN